jgi:hypothetical protein
MSVLIIIFLLLLLLYNCQGQTVVSSPKQTVVSSPPQYVLSDLYHNNAVILGQAPPQYDMFSNYSSTDTDEIIAINYPYDNFSSLYQDAQNAFRYAMGYVLGVPPSMIIVNNLTAASRGTTLIHFDVITATPRDTTGNLIAGSAGSEVNLVFNMINALFSPDKQAFFNALKTNNWDDQTLLSAIDNGALPSYTPANSGDAETEPKVLTNALIAFGFPEGTEVYYNDQPRNVGTIVTPRL